MAFCIQALPADLGVSLLPHVAVAGDVGTWLCLTPLVCEGNAGVSCSPSDVLLSGAVIAVGWICPSLQYRDVTMDFVRLSIKAQLSQLCLSPLPVHFLPSPSLSLN